MSSMVTSLTHTHDTLFGDAYAVTYQIVYQNRGNRSSIGYPCVYGRHSNAQLTYQRRFSCGYRMLRISSDLP